MTAANLQQVLARLIRQPESYRDGALSTLLSQFELTSHERWQLEQLAANPGVAKFGRIMRGGRYESVRKQMKLLRHFLPEELVRTLVEDEFEARALLSGAQHYPLDFMAMLRDDPAVRARLGAVAPVFVDDLVQFEHAQLLFRRQILDTTCPLPGPALLRHGCFVLLQLAHDVPAMLRAAASGKELADIVPEARSLRLLLVGDLAVPTCRTFEIDAEVWAFLEDQRRASQAGHSGRVEMPAQWQDLVDLGLIFAPSAERPATSLTKTNTDDSATSH